MQSKKEEISAVKDCKDCGREIFPTFPKYVCLENNCKKNVLCWHCWQTHREKHHKKSS